MANTIQLKRSSTPGAVPSAGSLAAGELAVNIYDGRIFINSNTGITDITGGKQSVVTLTDSGTIFWSAKDTFAIYKVTLAGNRLLLNPVNLVSGATYALIVQQDSVGGRTLSFSSYYKWPQGIAPVLSTSPNAVDIITFIVDGTNMYGVMQRGFA